MNAMLAGKTALVTGAASGIGAATAKAFAAAGAQVAGLDLKASTANGIEIFPTDVSHEESAIQGVAMAVRRLGGIDILVNSAGIMIDADLAHIKVADLDAMYGVNLRGPVLVTRAALPYLNDGARVINVASELAYLGRAGASGYCATKGAILSLTRSWARELGPRILVNAVAPGPTDTPLLNFEGLPPKIRALEVANPLARIAHPDEIASAIVFLAGPGAGFMTGQCIGVDGGAAMH